MSTRKQKKKDYRQLDGRLGPIVEGGLKDDLVDQEESQKTPENVFRKMPSKIADLVD